MGQLTTRGSGLTNRPVPSSNLRGSRLRDNYPPVAQQEVLPSHPFDATGSTVDAAALASSSAPVSMNGLITTASMSRLIRSGETVAEEEERIHRRNL